MFFRNHALTPLQRRSMQKMGAALLLTVLTNFSGLNALNPILDLFPGLARLISPAGHPSTLVAILVSAISVLPVLLAVWTAGTYLKAEPDEFVRALVVRALLWGVAVTMSGDAMIGAAMQMYGRTLPLAAVNGDLFFIGTGISLRLALRSYREEQP